MENICSFYLNCGCMFYIGRCSFVVIFNGIWVLFGEKRNKKFKVVFDGVVDFYNLLKF